MISLILNIAAFCFFVSELVKIYRRWQARLRMDSTSFEGTIMHVIGNFLIAVVSFLIGAWIAVFVETFLGVLGIVTLYWKFKWLRNIWKRSGIKLFDVFFRVPVMPSVVLKCRNCGELNVFIDNEEEWRCKHCGAPIE